MITEESLRSGCNHLLLTANRSVAFYPLGNMSTDYSPSTKRFPSDKG